MWKKTTGTVTQKRRDPYEDEKKAKKPLKKKKTLRKKRVVKEKEESQDESDDPDESNWQDNDPNIEE